MSDFPSLITEGIRVTVRTSYLKDESVPEKKHFAFAYQIEITNQATSPVQLISREWHIIDGTGQKRFVEGPGVVGKQPLIEPGETFRYVSGCNFPTPVGKMHGFYYMLRPEDQASLKVQIPSFTMVVPYLHN